MTSPWQARTAPLELSGVAPHAYIGNYRVLTIPTSDFGLDGNSPEIVAGIEQAVRDGMNVINLSLGEPEMTPSRDIVVQAIDAAAKAGVVPVIAAGNDFDVLGPGSIDSPGSAPMAITAAAATKGGVIAEFSSGGPAPISLGLKPDVSAPGVGILSSVPRRDGLWQYFDGTSMAAPHVAGAAALLLERHPTWTVATGQVGARADRYPGQGQHATPPRGAADARGRRDDQSSPGRPAPRVRQAGEHRVRALAAAVDPSPCTPRSPMPAAARDPGRSRFSR